jgi:hypothetical protein
MRSLRTVVIAISAISALGQWTHAIAADRPPQLSIPNPECDKERGQNVERLFKDLHDLDDLVPQVPPEEASYLEKEYWAAFRVRDIASY